MVSAHEIKSNRRKMLVDTASLGFFAATASSIALAEPNERGASGNVTKDDRYSSVDWLAQADELFFNSFIDSSFEFWSARGRARAALSNVRRFTATAKSDIPARAFSLDFLIQESTRTLPTDLCFVTHAKLGTFELFVVLHRNTMGNDMLMATFSRL